MLASHLDKQFSMNNATVGDENLRLKAEDGWQMSYEVVRPSTAGVRKGSGLRADGRAQKIPG